jgi:hypothetical protein
MADGLRLAAWWLRMVVQLFLYTPICLRFTAGTESGVESNSIQDPYR